MTVELDRWLSPPIRDELEQLYYARVDYASSRWVAMKPWSRNRGHRLA